MAKVQREPVKITQEHMEEYVRLRKRGLSYAQCIESVKKMFNMPVAHTQQAVYLRFKKLQKTGQSIEASKGKQKLMRTAKRTAQTVAKSIIPLLVEFDELEALLNGKREAIDKVIHLIAMAKKVPELEVELEKYKNGYERAMEGWDAERKGKQRREQQKQAYELALQHGDVNPPIGLPGRAQLTSDFTYHLALRPEFLALFATLFNISRVAFVFISYDLNISTIPRHPISVW